jgi:two-component system OmpR family sensor kinase
VWSALASLAFASLAGVFAFKFLTRPLGRLADAMKRFEAGQFRRGEALLTTRRFPDEVDALATTFSTMSTQIANYVDRLHEIDVQRRELVANVSHDLRTPLSAVQGYLDTLVIKHAHLSASERQNYLSLALEQSHKIERLVSALLELARLEGGEMALNVESFSACDLVQDVVESFTEKARNRQVALSADFDADVPLVRGDLRLIERILINLVDNALHHTPRGGTVTVRCAFNQTAVLLEVCDTGPGIDAKDLPHIFERFYRAATSRDERDGVGLGLAISQRIARLHGTAITVESQPGEGATFRFMLPIAVGEKPMAAASPGLAAN